LATNGIVAGGVRYPEEEIDGRSEYAFEEVRKAAVAISSASAADVLA